MTLSMRHHAIATLTGVLLSAGLVLAQNPPPQGNPPPGNPPQRPAGRQNLPPVTSNMNRQQLQDILDASAVIQAERRLQLTADQYPNFVARLRKVQRLRQMHNNQRMRRIQELRQLVNGPGPYRDEVLTERVKALDAFDQTSQQELRQAYLELDGVLTPWQQARFRLFEEELERQKIELLMKLSPQGGGGEATGPGRSGGLKPR
jgi:hypothetical protein